MTKSKRINYSFWKGLATGLWMSQEGFRRIEEIFMDWEERKLKSPEKVLPTIYSTGVIEIPDDLKYLFGRRKNEKKRKTRNSNS